MKKRALICIILVVAVALGVCWYKMDNGIRHPYTQEYVVGQGNIKGDVDVESFSNIDSRFAIGADEDGYAVFKDPDAAYEALLEKYSVGIAVIKNEFNLDDLSKKNYSDYKTYGWQVTSGSEKEQEQASFVSGFFDIYENSF